MSSCLEERVEAKAGSTNIVNQLSQSLHGNSPLVTSLQQQWHTPFLSRDALKGFAQTKSKYTQKTHISAAEETEGSEYGHSRATTRKS